MNAKHLELEVKLWNCQRHFKFRIKGSKCLSVCPSQYYPLCKLNMITKDQRKDKRDEHLNQKSYIETWLMILKYIAKLFQKT